MRRAVILFEDHTAAWFRPLSWSVPVYELGCGLMNLRERVVMLTADSGPGVGLLPRSGLRGLQDVAPPPGCVCGGAACRDLAAAAESVLVIASRLGADWEGLRRLLGAGTGPSAAWSDEDGLVAAVLTSAEATALLREWEAWDAAAAASACWRRDGEAPPPWSPSGLPPASGEPPRAWRALWERVTEIGAAVAADIAVVAGLGSLPPRAIFGVVPDAGASPAWTRPTSLRSAADLGLGPDGSVAVLAPDRVWLGEEVALDPGVVLDARQGPILLGREVHVESHALIVGPVCVGAGSLVKAGTRLYGESAVGDGCKIAGEIAESQLAPLGNKQHEGFLGHALLGSWVNLGAGTTNSDLKNNYGPVRVDLGLGARDSGLRFLGLMMGDHAKTAIGTLFNTGTVVGFASNVFAAAFPPKFLPNLSWGDGAGASYDALRAADTARQVMARRGCLFTEAHSELFRSLSRDSS